MIFDGGMERRDLPALSIATRGLAAFNLRVRTGGRDLHSGMYGNAALNAIHALTTTLGGILPRDGRVPDALRVGIAPVTDEERAGWEQQPPGAEVLREAGAVPYDPQAAEEFYLRTTAETAVDVNGILGGKPGLKNTTVVSRGAGELHRPARARPGSEAGRAGGRAPAAGGGARAGATVEVEELEGSTRPGLVDPKSDVVKIAQDAFETAFGIRPILTRSGGTLPIMPALADKGIPTILTGFALPESNVHSPNERMLVEFFPRGIDTIKRALHPPWRPLLAPSSRPRSRPSWPRTCSTASSATSGSTRSPPTASTTSPSTEKQLDLARLLRDELEEIGLDDVRLDEHGYVYGSLAGAESAPAIGLIAHVDTSPDVTGTGVDPQVHRGYDGGRIELPREGVVLDPQELPLLATKVGHDIVTSDGTTLLGADDKAGVAEIMAAVAYLKRHPELAHAPIRVCFTVDEEVAGGAEHLDLERFGARYAYTLDGSELGEIEAETFNAWRVLVTIRGRSTHPGTAKGQLVNAIKLAADFVAALPRDGLSPETTEEREGFVHPTRISGGAEEASVELIVRDHDLGKIEEHLALLRRLAAEVAEREPRAAVEVQDEEQYRNMGEVIDRHPEVLEAAEEAVRRIGVEPVRSIIRGGTDGARLSHRGLPTPNLFTGGSEYHSRREWASVQDMAAAAAMIVELARVWAERTA